MRLTVGKGTVGIQRLINGTRQNQGVEGSKFDNDQQLNG